MEKKFIIFKKEEIQTEEKRRENIREIEKSNKEIYLKKQKELKRIKMVLEQNEPKKEVIENIEQDKTIELEEFDITFYHNLLKSCPKIEELPHYLPKRKNIDFEKIMNLLIVTILKEIEEIENFIIKESLKEEEKKEFIEEIKEKRCLMNELINFRDKKEEWQQEIEEEKENTLIYLQSPSGNYYCFIDEKKIDIDYYASFLGLLESIKNGTFKNIKVLLNNKIKGLLLEVKDFKTRIVFQRIAKDTYVILSMFIKKVDKNSIYIEQLEKRIVQYQKSLNSIKESLTKEEYKEENRNVTNTLIKMLKKGE